MKRTLLMLLAVAIELAVASAQTALPKVYDESLDQNAQIDDALAQAKREGKFVVCQVGGNWCPWCLRFAHFVTDDAEISKVISDNFVYIHVNYSGGRSSDVKGQAREEKMMTRLGHPGRFGFPVFVVLDERGKVIHTQDSSFLEEGNGYDKAKVMRFFQNWTPKAVKEVRSKR